MPKRSNTTNEDATLKKKHRNVLTLEMKLKIIERVEAGGSFATVGRENNLAESTVRTIVKNKEKYKKCSETVNPTIASRVSRTRSYLTTQMETLLSNWIEDANQRSIPISSQIIMKKALSLWNDLKLKHGGEETFKASKGWFDRFRKRTNLHNCVGESAADLKAAQNYPKEFRDIVERGNYPPNLVFNVDETGLFWKRMPSHTFISKEERIASGFKVAQDRLALLLGGNASGEFKLKPLLVYQSETPRVMRGYTKTNLPVVWRSNRNAWVTKDFFADWFQTYFCPAVKKYCEDINVEPRALLILDNAPCHPTNLSTLSTEFPVEVVFLPLNTTSILQPMEQGVIATFKAYYLRRTLSQLIEECDVENRQSMRNWWNNFHIMKAIRNIQESWDEVSQSSMKSVWKKLYSEIVSDIPANEDDVPTIIKEISCIATFAGIEGVDEENIEELLESHGELLTNEDLQDMNRNVDLQEEEAPEPGPSRCLTVKVIEEALLHHNRCMELLEENDPNFVRITSIKRGCNVLFECYRQILRNKQKTPKQLTLDSFLKRCDHGT